MLFKEIHLQGIKSGTIHLAFRKWEKSTIKKGSLLKTAIGLVEIIAISTIEENDVTDADIIHSGFENREQLLKSLRQIGNGNLYKIAVRYHSDDPRIALREQTVLTDESFLALRKKLERLDKYSTLGTWTTKVLLAINKYPHKKAVELASLTGYEKEWLKLNIRKLKNLGLTISHTVGYEISPLGKVVVKKLLNEA